MLGQLFKNVGTLLMCLSMAGIGYVYKNDALSKSEFDSFLNSTLKDKVSQDVLQMILKKSFNVLTTFVMSGGVGFIAQLDTFGTVSGFSLALLNYALNFNVQNVMNPEFVLLNLLALSMIVMSFSHKKQLNQ